MSQPNGATAGMLLDANGQPVTLSGCPVLFAVVLGPNGQIGFVRGQEPDLRVLHNLLAWVESFRFTAYQRALGLEPKVVAPAAGLVLA